MLHAETNPINQMDHYIFFLGGYDLEMLEIKNILQSHYYTFFDKGLSWGAKASDYKDELLNFPAEKIPVLIELFIDVELPENSIIIAHHNEKAGKEAKTSIEQVADLLGIRLNRHQELISANDKGHIRGMQDIGATDEEIRLIRSLDRQAQGVTEEDERLAEESISKHLQVIDEYTAIVHSLTKKTSAVFDRLYDNFQDIYVITPDGEINFSGRGKTVLHLVELCKDKRLDKLKLHYWYGGNLPVNGYFGVKGLEISDFTFFIKEVEKCQK